MSRGGSSGRLVASEVPLQDNCGSDQQGPRSLISRIKIVSESAPPREPSPPPLTPHGAPSRDLSPPRRPKGLTEAVFSIRHTTQTEIGEVGKQLWQGAGYLSQFLWVNRDELKNETFLGSYSVL